MFWFKHDSGANMDAKLQEVLLDYGLEGYGLYWYCIELIVGKIDKNNLTFELEHDARIIAKNTGSTPQKTQEMMLRFVEIGLFEDAGGHITCLKLAKRLDQSMTSNPEMRDLIKDLRDSHDSVMINPDSVMQEQIRLEQIRLDKTPIPKTKVLRTPSCPQKEILALYHEKLPELRHMRTWTGGREKNLTARWKQNPKYQTLQFWSDLFDYVRESDFLMGKVPRKDREPFAADLEFIIQPKSFARLFDGFYHGKK